MKHTEYQFTSRALRYAEGAIFCEAAYEAPLLQATPTTSYKSAGTLWSSATLARAKLYEYQVGLYAAGYAASDTAVQWDLSRFSTTAIMTATAVTPNPLDPGDAAATSLFSNNQTAEPTYVAAATGVGLNLQNQGLNQRGSYRWRALDDGDQIIVPNISGAGVGLRVQLGSAISGSAVGSISFTE